MKQAEKETGYVLRRAYPILFLIGNHLIDLVGCFIRFFGNDVIEGKDLICICFKLICDDREGGVLRDLDLDGDEISIHIVDSFFYLRDLILFDSRASILVRRNTR